MERLVRELCEMYNKAAESPTVGVVRLSGLVHSLERVAFREIARQLCRCVHHPFQSSSAYVLSPQYAEHLATSAPAAGSLRSHLRLNWLSVADPRTHIKKGAVDGGAGSDLFQSSCGTLWVAGRSTLTSVEGRPWARTWSS